jgi:hypothetical protein
MYNTKDIEKFMDKVHKEANEAAQKVYDKYTDELIRRIQNQLFHEDKLHIGMGSASISRKQSEGFFGEPFAGAIARTQYCEELDANFILPSYIYKTETKK